MIYCFVPTTKNFFAKKETEPHLIFTYTYLYALKLNIDSQFLVNQTIDFY